MESDNSAAHHFLDASGDANEAIDPNQPVVNRRRRFLKSFGLAGAALSAGAMFSARTPAKAASGVSSGDIHILRLLAAANARGPVNVGALARQAAQQPLPLG